MIDAVVAKARSDAGFAAKVDEAVRRVLVAESDAGDRRPNDVTRALDYFCVRPRQPVTPRCRLVLWRVVRVQISSDDEKPIPFTRGWFQRRT